MVPRRRKHVQTGEGSGFAPVFYGQFRAKPSKISGLAARYRQYPAEEEQVAGLHDLHIRSHRCGNRGKLNVVVMQPLFCASLPSARRSRVVHRMLLLIVLSQDLVLSQQDKEKPRGDERDGCLLVAIRVHTTVSSFIISAEIFSRGPTPLQPGTRTLTKHHLFCG